MRKLTFLLGTILILSVPVSAQDRHPGADVFGGFTYLNSGGSSRQNLFGWQASAVGDFKSNLGLVGDFKSNLGLVGDFAGQYKNVNGASVSLYEYLFGPQLSFRGDRTSAFVHAMLGGATAHGSATVPVLGITVSTSSTGFAMGFGGGFDVQVSKTVAIRAVQFDYIPDHAGGAWSHNVRLAFGAVFRLGGAPQRPR